MRFLIALGATVAPFVVWWISGLLTKDERDEADYWPSRVFTAVVVVLVGFVVGVLVAGFVALWQWAL